MVELTRSEKKVLAKIRKTMQYSFGKQYMFWFVYNEKNEAVNWEGGYGLTGSPQFRNEYTIEKGKQVVKNW